MSGKRCLVIGSGIIGAAIAWNLQRSGAQVTVLDGGEPGGQATRNSWAWINASWGNPEPYFRLRERSMLEWRKIDRDVPGLSVEWCGGLIWDLEPAALEAYAEQHSGWGYGIRRVDGEAIRALEPNLATWPAVALHVAEEGMVEPLATAQTVLAGAAALGADIVPRMRAKWLIEQDGRIAGAMTDEGRIHADETIVAAGVGSPALLDTAGIKLKLTAPAGLLSHSKPVGELLHGLVMTPGLHVRQTAEGRLVAGTDFAGADPLDDPQAMARDLHAKVQSLIRGAENVELDFHTVGYRPTPADGFPAIGRPRQRDGLYVAVTHSGITLAPIIGLFAAQELLDGRRDPLLEPYSPDRPALT
jgi:glycine/D-amino acid oxidase-like deaminating enzyme